MKSNVVLFGTIVFSICLLTILLLMFYSRATSQSGHHHYLSNRSSTDLDTLSSELDLSVDIELQSTPALCVSMANHGTVLRNQKPKGILKNSRTAETLHLYNNPSAESVVSYNSSGRPESHSVSDSQSKENIILPKSLGQEEENRDKLINLVEPCHLVTSDSSDSKSDFLKSLNQVSGEGFLSIASADCGAVKDVIIQRDTYR